MGFLNNLSAMRPKGDRDPLLDFPQGAARIELPAVGAWYAPAKTDEIVQKEVTRWERLPVWGQIFPIPSLRRGAKAP